MISHNAEHLAYTQHKAIAKLAEWQADHPDLTFTVEEVETGLTDNQRCVFVRILSREGEEIYFRSTFDEVRFDYDAFSRREWAAAITHALNPATRQ